MAKYSVAAQSGGGDLPDVNVWLALLNARHPHYAAAKRYWDEGGEGDTAPAQRILFCRIMMLGLLRLLTNKVVMGGSPYTDQQTWTAWQAVADLLEVAFLAEPAAFDAMFFSLTIQPGFRAPDWTDVDFAAFATLAGLRLVTSDKGLRNMQAWGC